MHLIPHTHSNEIVAEATSDAMILSSEQDVIPLLEALFSSGTNKLIVHQENIVPEFFDLRTGLAGAILQKFVNYQQKIAIVGDFTNVTSKSLNAFIYESNQGDQVFFVENVESAVQKLIGAGKTMIK